MKRIGILLLCLCLLPMLPGRAESQATPPSGTAQEGLLTLTMPNMTLCTAGEGDPVYVYTIEGKLYRWEAASRRLTPLRTAAEAMSDKSRAYLFPGWTEAIDRSSYAERLREWDAKDAQLAKAFEESQGNASAERAAQGELEAHRATITERERWHYDVSPEDPRHYREQVAPALFFPAPGVFTDWSQPGAELLDKEINRYLKGQLSAEQLAASLDQMARLMELAGQ